MKRGVFVAYHRDLLRLLNTTSVNLPAVLQAGDADGLWERRVVEVDTDRSSGVEYETGSRVGELREVMDVRESPQPVGNAEDGRPSR